MPSAFNGYLEQVITSDIPGSDIVFKEMVY